MNDLQMQMMSLERHRRILAREHATQTAATPQPQHHFAAAVAEIVPDTAPATPSAAPAPDAARVMNIPPIAPAAPAKAAAPMPSLSADQAALLAASMGASLPETAAPAPVAASAATSTPEMSDDQMATLMAGFGKAAPAPAAGAAAPAGDEALPQTAAAMAATAIPEAQDDNLRYFPLNTQAAAARQMSASDTYLRAMQQMEVNLGAYGGLKRNGR